MAAPTPVVDGTGRRIYHATGGGYSLSLVITMTACEDAASGEDFPALVTASVDGRLYRGCGRVLNSSMAQIPSIDSWVGKKLVREGAEAGAAPGDILERDLPEPYRIFEPGTVGDMMFNPERLNVVVDETGTITRVYWG
jgi:hypothetical protein